MVDLDTTEVGEGVFDPGCLLFALFLASILIGFAFGRRSPVVQLCPCRADHSPVIRPLKP